MNWKTVIKIEYDFGSTRVNGPFHWLGAREYEYEYESEYENFSWVLHDTRSVD